jgi:hypothetical protein
LKDAEPLAVRAGKKLKNDGLLIANMAGTALELEIDRVPLWRGNHVGVKQLADDFAKYLYLPRVRDPQVLADAIRDGVALFTWKQETFAYADSFDSTSGRYRGLQAGRQVEIRLNPESVVVKPGPAAEQFDRESAAAAQSEVNTGVGQSTGAGSRAAPTSAAPKPTEAVLRRFHASAHIDPTRLSRDVDLIASSVVQHLSGLLDASVKITIEIDAEIPSGAPDNVVRTVTENCRTLKFDQHGFDES